MLPRLHLQAGTVPRRALFDSYRRKMQVHEGRLSFTLFRLPQFLAVVYGGSRGLFGR